MTQLDNCLAWMGNGCARCFFPGREDHKGSKGCCKRCCGNPCRRCTKRCNECLGRPNHYPDEPKNNNNGTMEAPKSQEIVGREVAVVSDSTATAGAPDNNTL